MSEPKLFYSYSHVNEAYRSELEKWLTNLKGEGLLSEWHDRRLMAGDTLPLKIDEHLQEADIVLLLISQDFLASKACVSEMKYSLKNLPQKRIVPIILKTCTWQDTDCANLLALPEDGTPIDEWESKEKAWMSVYKGIKDLIIFLSQKFEIRGRFLEELQRIEFVSQQKHKVILDDIFVFPFLSKEKDIGNGDAVENEYFHEKKNKHIIIKGDETAGKTSLIRKLFIDLAQETPAILLEGSSIRKTRNFEDLIRKEFEREFMGDFDRWSQKDNRVVLIDNYDHKISNRLIEYLKANYSRIIMTVDDEEFLVYFKDDPQLADFELVDIKPFSKVNQEQLIQKWLSLTDDGVFTHNIDHVAVDQLEEKVNAVISANLIVPRYPFYILTVLQSLEAFMPKDLSITSYGHCYQALVTARLIKKNIGAEDLDSCFNFLTELACDIWQSLKTDKEYSHTMYTRFKEAYRGKFYIRQSVLTRMEDIEFPILKLSGEEVRFEYPYIYFFFLGKSFAEKNDKNMIEELFKDLHYRENAYIIIFIVHHTNNRDLLDTILLHCMCLFDSVQPAQLTKEETQFMTDLVATLPKNIISDRSIEENRRKERSLEEELVDDDDDKADEADIKLAELYKGLRILDILGQILKNRGGSFTKDRVLEILREAQDLGLRMLNLFLSDLKKPEFKRWLTVMLEEAEKSLNERGNRKLSYEEKKEFVEKTIQLFGYITTAAMISRITYSINSDKLLEGILELSRDRLSPSYSIIAFLVSMYQKNIDTELLEKLYTRFEDEKNFWALKTLSYYVQNFLNTHRVKFETRQKVFSILGLKYLPNR